MHILLYTHSDYFDILPIQLEYFRKIIEPLFYRITLVTNVQFDRCSYDHHIYNDSLPYSSRIRGALETINSEYVLVLHENDIILQLDADMITTLLQTMKSNKISSLELKHDTQNKDPIQITPTLRIGRKTGTYIFSVQPTLWNREDLLHLLKVFPSETYRTIENPNVHAYINANYKAYIMQTTRPVKTIWYTVDPCFVFLHLTSRLLLLPCRPTNGLHPSVQGHHEYIFSKYLASSSREVQPTLMSFLNHKVEEERLQSIR